MRKNIKFYEKVLLKHNFVPRPLCASSLSFKAAKCYFSLSFVLDWIYSKGDTQKKVLQQKIPRAFLPVPVFPVREFLVGMKILREKFSLREETFS